MSNIVTCLVLLCLLIHLLTHVRILNTGTALLQHSIIRDNLARNALWNDKNVTMLNLSITNTAQLVTCEDVRLDNPEAAEPPYEFVQGTEAGSVDCGFCDNETPTIYVRVNPTEYGGLWWYMVLCRDRQSVYNGPTANLICETGKIRAHATLYMPS